MSGCRRGLASSVALTLTGCLAAAACRAPDPFPVLEPTTDAEALAILAARTTGPATVSAELRMGFRDPERSGVFDAVATFSPDTGNLTLRAFKDLGFEILTVFELTFADGAYDVRVLEKRGAEPMRDTGPDGEFVQRHPTYRAFFAAREALVLPGAHDNNAATPARLEPVRADSSIRTLTTSLRSGACARWQLNPATFAVRAVEITPNDGTGTPIRCQYHGYRKVGPWFVPRRIELVDEDAGVRADIRVRYVERNTASPGPDDATDDW